MAKVKMTLSVDDDTAKRIRQFAYENHKPISQSVTDWIWAQSIENLQLEEPESTRMPQKGKLN